ncbi:MAG TPA: Crp/Fnr family transcriptional regulator [Bacteroidetes bacterium]|nr:Crp/Fnr family transcriptional regulator [Bacteroidota bacterium]
MATAKRLCETCKHYSCFINKYCSHKWKPIITFNKTTTDYPSGATIFSEGEPVRGIYEIYYGKIKVVSSFGNNKERILCLLSQEQMLGFNGLGGNMIYPVTAITLVPSQVTFIPIDIFYKAVKANPGMAIFLMGYYADQLRASNSRLKMYSITSAKGKVSSALLTIVDSFGFEKQDDTLLSFTPSRKDIASLAGTTYETVIRVLGELEKENVIRLEGKSIRVSDLSSLKKLSEEFNS